MLINTLYINIIKGITTMTILYIKYNYNGPLVLTRYTDTDFPELPVVLQGLSGEETSSVTELQ